MYRDERVNRSIALRRGNNLNLNSFSRHHEPLIIYFVQQSPTNCVTSSKPKEKSSRLLTLYIKMSRLWKSAKSFVCPLHTDVSALILVTRRISPCAELPIWTKLHCLTLNSHTWKSLVRLPTNSSRVTTVSIDTFIFH